MRISSTILAGASGAIAGLIAQPTPHGIVLRQRASKPTVQNNVTRIPQASLVRTAARWRDVLTPAQREAWETYAANVPIRGRLGQLIHLTGRQMYLRQAIARVRAFLSSATQAPRRFDLGYNPVPTSVVATASDQRIAVTWTLTLDQAWRVQDAFLIRASPPQNPSRRTYHGTYRRLLSTTTTNNQTGPKTASTTNTRPMAPGQLVFLEQRTSRADGRLSEPIYYSTIVQP